MAITLISRPTVYKGDFSPGGTYYSKWNATGKYDKIVYGFNVPSVDLGSRLRVNVYELGSDLLLATNTYYPFKSGTFNVDVASFVRSYLYSRFAPNFNFVNSIDNGATVRFYIGYQVDDEVEIRDTVNPINAVHAAMPLGNSNGSNMSEYVPINVDTEDKAKFLTIFEKPVMFIGYPYIISFIYDPYLMGKELKLNVKELDANLAEIDEYEYELDRSAIYRVNYIVMPSIVNSDCKNLKISIKTGEDVNDYYVDEGYVDEGYIQII
jgi:hypothetical protein